MTNEKIHQLVKNLEPLFLGFTAHEDRLKNSNGMELRFHSDWSGKTTVSGLHANHRHSIGCSFEKPIEKIFKDIRRRLMPGYHADFFETKRGKLERAEAEEAAKLKLKALASVIGGNIEHRYGHRSSCGNEYVSAENVSIYPTYRGLYEFNLELGYAEAMKLAEILRDFIAVEMCSQSENSQK